MSSRVLTFTGVLFTVSVIPLAVMGQPIGKRPVPATTATRSKPPLTQVTVELMTGNEGVGLRAHRWRDIFEKLDVTFVVRRSLLNEKPEIKERRIGDSVRQVQVTGRLETNGRLVFADHTFTEGDVAKLTEWLKDLKTYGAQGTPEGQPAWGLTKQQFGHLHEALAKTLTVEPQGRDIALALALFELPGDFPLKLSEAARKSIEAGARRVVVQQAYAGLSLGTALAALLREHGLGFRPRRLPDGRIELTVIDLAESDDVWPVGWMGAEPGQRIAPGLFKFHQIELDGIELSAVLDSARDLIGIPILVDSHGLKSRDIDVSQIKVSYPAKKTTWGIALGTLVFKAHARYELLIDESGKPLLWITHTANPRRPELQSAEKRAQ